MSNLTEEQLKNLQVFLSRVQLTGAEVGAFNNLISALFPPKNGVVDPQEVSETVQDV